ncbi:MAG: response regulator [Treponema sp.]|nr:response regulator [Treponema sp.]
MQKTIFVVDDNDTNLSAANDVLQEQYRVMTLPSASKMFKLLEKITPDMILLDIEMPEMDGFDALRKLKTNSLHANIPVIFLTGMTDAAVEVRGFQLGVVDFITKPFSAPVLLNRIKTHLHIDEIIRERTAQIQRLKNAIVFSFADIVEKRDHETGGHVERTSEYIEILVNAMIERGVYSSDLSNMDLESLVSSARLHDIGKITIPDSILNKPGKLNDDEFKTMKTHSAVGVEIISQMASRADDDEFLRNAKLFAGFHHERWDGNGYPYGLKEIKIPIQGRIMAIVDVYDALISERPYKKPFTADETVKIIMDNAGKQFDPIIADVFYELKDRFQVVNHK